MHTNEYNIIHVNTYLQLHVEEAYAPECIVQQVVSTKKCTGLFVCVPAANACSFPVDVMLPIALKQRFTICPELAISSLVHSLADLGRLSQGKRGSVTHAGLGTCAHLAQL